MCLKNPLEPRAGLSRAGGVRLGRDLFFCTFHHRYLLLFVSCTIFLFLKKEVSKYLYLLCWGIIDIVKLHMFKIDLF